MKETESSKALRKREREGVPPGSWDDGSEGGKGNRPGSQEEGEGVLQAVGKSKRESSRL